MSLQSVMDRDKIIIWSGLATGAVIASATLYWAGKKLLDDYVPYEVRTELLLRLHQLQHQQGLVC